jgi:hypothetical protein
MVISSQDAIRLPLPDALVLGLKVTPCPPRSTVQDNAGVLATFAHFARRLRWNRRQRKAIFELLLQRFGAMIGKMANEHQPSPATLWRVTVESWLRRQGWITVRPNSQTNVSTNSNPFFPQN